MVEETDSNPVQCEFDSHRHYMTEITKVGVGVAILRHFSDGTKVLLGKRKSSHGEGQWAFPGGHLEHLESFKETALREIKEETGNLKVRGLEVVSIINLTEYTPKHYLDVGMVAFWLSGEPEVMEPDKCSEWQWFSVYDLPNPVFSTVKRVIDAAMHYRAVVVYDKE